MCVSSTVEASATYLPSPAAGLIGSASRFRMTLAKSAQHNRLSTNPGEARMRVKRSYFFLTWNAQKCLLLIAVGLLMLVSAPARAFVFVENFNSGSPSPSLTVDANAGFAVSLHEGNALFSQAAGTGNGGISIMTRFLGIGDFETTVIANRDGTGAAQFGMWLSFESAVPHKTGNVFFGQYLGYAVWSNIGSPGNWASDGVGTTVEDAVFRLRRVGSTLYAEADIGNGFQVLNAYSSPNIAGPVRFGLFFSQEFGVTAANVGRLDDWRISAASAVPEPATASIFLIGLMALITLRRLRGERVQSTERPRQC